MKLTMVSNMTTCNCNKDNNGIISNNVITTAEEYHPTSRFCNICRAGIICCKGKSVPLHAMEALGGRGGIAPTHSRPRQWMGVSGQRHAPAAFYPRGKDSRYPLDRRLGGLQSRSGHRQRKNPLPLPGIEPRSADRPVRSQTLYWLSYPAPSLLCIIYHFRALYVDGRN
jgi:hypothetical protein